MIIFVLSFTVINIALWIIMLVRFKKLFSTDLIIEKTRTQMNQMIVDIDKTTDRDMFLVRESEKRLREELAEADKKMELFKEATERLRDMIAEADRINKASASKRVYDFSSQTYGSSSIEKKAAASYLKEQKLGSSFSKRPELNIDPDSSFELNSQNELFPVQNENPIIKDEIKVTQDGAAYKEVPLIITKVYDEQQNQSDSEMNLSLNEQVKKLYEQGYKAEEIALQLSCSITEVQFIIDML